jgi:hypothetical protein
MTSAKWPGKLEYRGTDPKKNPDRLRQKEHRVAGRKEELNGTESEQWPETVTDGKLFVNALYLPVVYPGIFFGGVQQNQLRTEDRERGSGGGSPLVRGSTQFANELNPYSDYVVTDVFSTKLGIRLSFVKTSEFFCVGGC